MSEGQVYPCPRCGGLGDNCDGSFSLGPAGYEAKPATPCGLCKGRGQVLVFPLADAGEGGGGLAEHAAILNRHGPDSPEVTAWLARHAGDRATLLLAAVATALWKALRRRRQ